MSLREEISEIMNYARDDSYINRRMPDEQYIDRIMKAIEKRIDSVKEQKDNHNYSGDDEFVDGFSLGFNHAIEKLEEMLK